MKKEEKEVEEEKEDEEKEDEEREEEEERKEVWVEEGYMQKVAYENPEFPSLFSLFGSALRDHDHRQYSYALSATECYLVRNEIQGWWLVGWRRCCRHCF